MKKNLFKPFLTFTALVVLIVGILFGCATQLPPVDTGISGSFVLAHLNDTHGRISEGAYAGMGFAKVFAKVNSLRESGTPVLFMDAGDTLHGQTIVNLSRGATAVEVLNAVGVDVMAPGNHDFNFGYDRLKELEQSMDFPLIACNVVKHGTTELAFEPYVILDAGELKIGVIGATTPETYYKTHPDNVTDLDFLDPGSEVQRYVDRIKHAVHVVVLLSHIGIDEASEFTSERIAREVSGIDIIVDGHSHTELPQGMLVNNTWIVQTGEYDKNLGTVEISYDNGNVSILPLLFSKADAEMLTPDPDILALIEDIELENEKITSVVVGTINEDMDGERANVRTQPTNLGDFANNALLSVSGADVALTNGGNIRASLYAGEITYGDIITVFPFGNTIVVKEITGAQLLAALENSMSALPEPDGRYGHWGGLTYDLDIEQPVGSRVSNVMVNGIALSRDAAYALVTNDFLVAGGDDYDMLTGTPTVAEFGTLDEILITYIQNM